MPREKKFLALVNTKMRNINWKQSRRMFAVLSSFRLVQKFEFINDTLANTFTIIMFSSHDLKLWNLWQISEKKTIKIFQWLIRKHAFCWHSLCCCLFVHLHKSWYENAIEFNRFHSATAWKNVVLSPRCADVVVYNVSQQHLLFQSKAFCALKPSENLLIF